MLLTLGFQFVFNFLVGNRRVLSWNFHTLVVAQLNFWLNGNFGSQYPWLTLFQTLNIDLWLVNWFDTGFFNSIFVSLWQHDVQSILVQSFFTVHLVKQLTWHVALTETRNRDPFLRTLKGLVNTLLSRFNVDFKS